MNYLKYNERFWDFNAKSGRTYSQRCTRAEIEKARCGDPPLYFLGDQQIPRNWLPQKWDDIEVLALGLGGGEQVPLLAATGASVTSLDISKEQLNLDHDVCERENLKLKTIQGNLGELDNIADESFDLMLAMGLSNVKDVYSLWGDFFRILRPEGILISGMVNPVFFTLDEKEFKNDRLVLKKSIPYDGSRDLSEAKMLRKKKLLEPIRFGHSLEDLIGAQLRQGFVMTGFIEGGWANPKSAYLDSRIPTFMATCGKKLGFLESNQ